MRIGKLVWALVVAAAATSGAGAAESAGDCAGARRELESARRSLADATRSCDQRGAAYHACMERSKNQSASCQPERRAREQASSQKRDAHAAHRYAMARQREACR